MKRVFLVLGLCLFMVGCENTKNEETTTKPSQSTAIKTIKKITPKNIVEKMKKHQTEIIQDFINRASKYAKKHKQVLSEIYFEHGASNGDWFATTPDGLALVQIQTEENEKNSKQNFPLTIIGGFTLYTSQSGTTGKTTEVEEHYQTADGFKTVADNTKPITKYILVDNGLIYEYHSSTSFTDGFNVTDENGKSVLTSDNPKFNKVEAIELQKAYQKVLEKY